MQNKKKNTTQKGGVSLIVLVITIVVMVILAAAVIVSLNNTSILDKAQEAVDKNNAQEEQTASIIESLWNLITGSGTVPVTPPPSTPQEDEEIDTDNWELAWTYTVTNGVGVWSDTLVKAEGDELLEGANIVAKAYTNGKTTSDLVVNEGSEDELQIPAGSAYTLNISGNGVLGNLIADEDYFAWQNEEIIFYITQVKLSKGITNIPEYAFLDCMQLNSIVIEEGSELTEVGDYSFADCMSLESVSLPASVSKIGEGAFENCFKLSTINILSTDAEKFDLGENAFNEIKSGYTIYVQNAAMQKIFTDAGYNAVVVEE